MNIKYNIRYLTFDPVLKSNRLFLFHRRKSCFFLQSYECFVISCMEKHSFENTNAQLVMPSNFHESKINFYEMLISVSGLITFIFHPFNYP